MSKLALAMILKASPDEAKHFEACLASVGEHVDAIYVLLNHPKKVPVKVERHVRDLIAQYELKDAGVSCEKWKGHFADMRNKSFALVPKEYDAILWLDADDTVENPEKLRETVDVMPKGVSGVYATYDYAHDEYGNVTVPHVVARIVRNNGAFAWKSSFDDEDYSVHETLNETRSTGKRVSEEFKVIHHADATRSLASLYRNLEILEGMFKKQSEKGRVDPRILFYLGTHLFDAQRFLEAKQLLQQYMQVSGWANERSEALVYLGLIHDLEGKPGQAKQAYVLAISEAPNNPRPYTEIAELCLKGKRPDEAAQWAMKAIECKTRQTAMALRPMDATFRPYVLYSKALTELGGTRLETAMQYVTKALKLRPRDPETLSLQENLEGLIEIRDLNRAYARLVRAIGDDKDKVKHLLQATPQKLLNSPLVAQVRFAHTPSRDWTKGASRSMVIFCGPSVFESWGPNSLKEGIGGSEEAVIRLSRELAKRGPGNPNWRVDIYATPGQEVGMDPATQSGNDGVVWHHYWEFNPNDEFDVLVGWRNPGFFDAEYKARKKYLWMHDVMPQNEFTEERLANLDKVILLSDYHRSLFPNIPDHKVFRSANGITPEDFDIEPIERNPHRVIYMSSHVRGLQLVYDMWPDIKKAVPDAIADLYYGWESYINVNKDNPERMLWMEHMQAQEKELEGVTDHGKISQGQIVQEIFSSGVWVYPCPFPEISCITAIKAQAGGAVPVSSNFAALNETVQHGVKIPMKAMDEDAPIGQWNRKDIEKFKAAIIDMLQHPEKQEALRPKMMAWAREQSWANVATSWTEEML